MAKHIIIKPLITEKTTRLAEDPSLNKYTFQVVRSANKIEIKKAVEEQFGVTVLAVNTLIRPGKNKSRIVKGRMTKGRTSAIKKAIVTVAEGDIIEDFYGEEDLIEDDVIADDAEVNA